MEALATVYLVPFSSVVTGSPSGSPRRDFRRVAESGAAPLSYETLGRLHRFDQFYEVARRLVVATSSTEDLGIPTPPDFYPHDLGGVSGWESKSGSTSAWLTNCRGAGSQTRRLTLSGVAGIERAGVFVFRQGMDITDLRGASRWDTGGPAAILINTADRVVAQTFTALHEFTHLVARAHDATNICDISDPWGNEETFANKVAGSALLPESLIRGGSRTDPNSTELPRLALARERLRDASGVSHAVIGIRLKQLKLVQDSGYRPFWRTKSGFGRGQPQKRWQRTERHVGTLTKTLARRALAEERIQPAELARMLDLKLSEVERLFESR